MISNLEGEARRSHALLCSLLVPLAALGLSACGADDPGANGLSSEVPDVTSAASEAAGPTVVTAPDTSQIVPETTAAAPLTTVAIATTSAPDFSDLRPPSDPSVLIGTVIDGDYDDSAPPPPSLQSGLPISVNGAPTTLVSTGGSCLDNCDLAVEFVIDAAALESGLPASRYLLLVSFVSGRQPNTPAHHVEDALVIDPGATDSNVSLLGDDCSFPGLEANLVPIAYDIDFRSPPSVPDRVWVVDEMNRKLIEVAVNPQWTCQPYEA